MEADPALFNMIKMWKGGAGAILETEADALSSPCAVVDSSRRRKRGVPRAQRSRSSPIRSGCSGTNSPERRARSPSSSTLRTTTPLPDAPAILSPHSILYNYNNSATNAVAFYSPRPPSSPMFLVPLMPKPAPLINVAFESTDRRQKKTPKKTKESKNVVRQILRSILREVGAAIAAHAIPPGDTVGCTVKAVSVLPAKAGLLYRNVASQTKPKNIVNRQSSLGDEDNISGSSMEYCADCEEACEWAGNVRALRDSHVRLVLRQLRQLRDIERLNRTLHRAHGPS